MSLQIETAWVQQFRANFDMLAQQMDARLVSTVTFDTLAAEVGYRDQIGAVDPIERTTRHGDTPYTEVPHARRQFIAQDWEAGEIIDRQDTMRMLTDPQSAYARAFAAGFNRRRDTTILRGMFATARIGKTGSSTVAFPAGQQIAVDYVETGSPANSGMTVAKLRRARELLMDAEAGDDGEFYIACSQRELNGLLRATEVTSSDFNDVKALVDGKVDQFMGFTFKRLPSQRFELDGSSHRRIPAYHKSGVLFSQMSDTVIQAAPDPTKSFNTRLYGMASFGATRLEEVKVVEIKVSTSVF